MDFGAKLLLAQVIADTSPSDLTFNFIPLIEHDGPYMSKKKNKKKKKPVLMKIHGQSCITFYSKL